MLLENKKVAIVGGGPGGLTLARLLQHKGVAVKVYERDVNREVRVQGATLDLHYESGLKALEVAGLIDAFKENYRPGADKGRVVDQQARIIYDEHDAAPRGNFGDESFRPEIDRGPLRDMLLNSLQPGTVVWDSQFRTMAKDGHAWRLEFRNGAQAMADIVIGADGANSRIRPFVTQIKSFYAGIVILQANVPESAKTVPNIHHLLKGGKIYCHSGGKSLHVSSKGDGSLDFYISFKVEENGLQNSGTDFSDRAQLLKWFEATLAGWDAVWFELIRQASLPILIRPQYCIPLDQTWDAQPDIAILGDAAHIMPPSGEGVNLAMLDALELSECLTGDDFGDIRSAIATYEGKMRTRGAAEAEESLKMMEWMHADDAQERMSQLLHPAPQHH